jgi:hypothetical protein
MHIKGFQPKINPGRRNFIWLVTLLNPYTHYLGAVSNESIGIYVTNSQLDFYF